MPRALFRVARRFASFEPAAETALADIISTEFSVGGQPDLELSVYEVEDSPGVHAQVFAEHVAGSGLGPRIKPGKLIDVSGLAEATRADEATPFSFIRDAHRILRFPEVAEQMDFVVALLADLAGRTRVVRKQDSQAYVVKRLGAGDPEWAQILRDRPDWAEHYKALVKKG